jgi:hypothetical protein
MIAKALAPLLCFALVSGGCGRVTESFSSERVADRGETGIPTPKEPPQETSAPPPPARPDPADVAFARELVGKSLGALLDAFAKHPAVNARFAKLLGADRATLDVCTEFSPSVKVGDTLVTRACRPQMCAGYQVIVVVDLAAGTLHCGIKTDDRVTAYSEDPKNLPEPLVAWRKDPSGTSQTGSPLHAQKKPH